MKFIKKHFTKLLFITGICVFLSGKLSINYAEQSLDNLREINNHNIIIGDMYFLSQGNFHAVNKQIYQAILHSLEMQKLFGVDEPIHIALQSGGGYVHLYEMVSRAKLFKQAYIVCTVSKAESVAFTFMMNFCDERIILKDAVVMTHKVYISGLLKYFTDSTQRFTVKHSDSEAAVLDLDKDEWYKFSRENGDKYFTVEEMKKYKIGTKFQ